MTMMMKGANGWIITFLVIAFIAIIGNTASIIQLLRLGSLNAITSKLILFLHISGLIHSIGQMPLFYYQDEILCEVMGFTHFYAGLLNAFSLVLLSMTYTNFVLEKYDNNIFIQKYCTYIVFITSLIALLPFSTHSYGASGIWCTLPITNEVSNIWSFMVSYIEVTVALFYSSGMLIYVIVITWKDRSITQTVLSAAGVYILVTWIGLIPGLIPRLLELCLVPINNHSGAGEFFEKAPSNMASIAYCLCFVYNYSSFTLYEKHFSRTNYSNDQLSLVEFEKMINERLSRVTIDGRSLSASYNSNIDDRSRSRSRARSRSGLFVRRYLSQLITTSTTQEKASKSSAAPLSTENPIFGSTLASRNDQPPSARPSTNSILEVERDSDV